MARRYNQGEYQIKNPQKYIGKKPCTYRSAWELAFMNVLDKHPNVLQWASESLEIPYQNPFTRQNTIYIPDFLVIYIDRNGQKHGEVIEIKPMKEASPEHAKSKRDKAALALNQAKWMAAIAWCTKHGFQFRVMTEEQLFQRTGRKK